MKTLVQINSVCNGSTGKIMCQIADEAEKQGFKTYNFFGRGLPKKEGRDNKFESKLSVYFHVLIARLGFNGHGSFFATRKLVKKLKEINPDIIHMHNIHGYYINLKVLFNYLKNEYKGKIVWTLHDCWSFTGHCSHFDHIKCNKWKRQCKNCPQLREYPKIYLDTTKKEYILKKNLFNDLNNLIIITPSKWLANLVMQSYLNGYKIQVINNGIDTEIFKPYSIEECEEIYLKYKLPKNKKIILGVASVWTERKGINDFIKLSKVLTNEYQVVLVGIDDKTQKNIPDNIITIKRTDNQVDLAKIYSCSHIYFNASVEETFGLTSIEAIACGTPVLVYDKTAIPESINEYVGIVIPENHDIFTINNYIKSFSNKKFNIENLQKYCKKYEIKEQNIKYLNIYKSS